MKRFIAEKSEKIKDGMNISVNGIKYEVVGKSDMEEIHIAAEHTSDYFTSQYPGGYNNDRIIIFVKEI